MDRDDVEVLEETNCYRGFFRVDRLRLKHRRFAGDWTPEVVREVIRRRPAVVILPYDPVRDRVVLIEQFRVGALAAGRPAWLIEIPAGLVEGDEEPEEVARRELEEEIGRAPEAVRYVTGFLSSPGGFDEWVDVFCARLDSRGVEGIHGAAAEHEDIRVFSVPADEAIAMAEDGRISNVFTIVALQWLRLNREALRRDWGTLAPPEAGR